MWAAWVKKAILSSTVLSILKNNSCWAHLRMYCTYRIAVLHNMHIHGHMSLFQTHCMHGIGLDKWQPRGNGQCSSIIGMF